MVVGFECRPNGFAVFEIKLKTYLTKKKKTTAPQKRRQGRVFSCRTFDDNGKKVVTFSNWSLNVSVVFRSPDGFTDTVVWKIIRSDRIGLFRRTITNEIRAKCVRVTVFPVTAVAPRIQPSRPNSPPPTQTPAFRDSKVSFLPPPPRRPLLTRLGGLAAAGQGDADKSVFPC